MTDVHLRVAFVAHQAVRGYMVEQDWRRLVCVSRPLAAGAPRPGRVYGCRVGPAPLRQGLRRRIGLIGITANIVAPGFASSEITDHTAALLGRSEEHRRIAAESIIVLQVGEPDDIAHVMAFFTGQMPYTSGNPHLLS